MIMKLSKPYNKLTETLTSCKMSSSMLQEEIEIPDKIKEGIMLPFEAVTET